MFDKIWKNKNTVGFVLPLMIFFSSLVLVNYVFLSEESFYVELFQLASLIDFRKLKEKPIVLIFAGDIMLDRGIEYMIEKYGAGDYKFPFLKIVDDLKGADILFANLESVISDKGKRVGSIYSFRAGPEAVEGLKYAGFDVVSVANNHIFDYGKEAMEDSLLRLKGGGIDFVGGGFSGKEAHSPVIKEVGDPSAGSGQVKIAFLAYTNLGSKNWEAREDFSGIVWLDERIVNDIEKAKKQANIVIVSIHWGDEYQVQPNQEQKYFGRLAIDAGADLVVGHHPHVAQPIEEYKDGYIAYSLGNFIFDQGFSEETMRGLLLKVLIEDDKIKKVTPIEIKINQFFQPEVKKL